MGRGNANIDRGTSDGRDDAGAHCRAAAAAAAGMSVMLLKSACFALSFAWASSSCDRHSHGIRSVACLWCRRRTRGLAIAPVPRTSRFFRSSSARCFALSSCATQRRKYARSEKHTKRNVMQARLPLNHPALMLQRLVTRSPSHLLLLPFAVLLLLRLPSRLLLLAALLLLLGLLAKPLWVQRRRRGGRREQEFFTSTGRPQANSQGKKGHLVLLFLPLALLLRLLALVLLS